MGGDFPRGSEKGFWTDPFETDGPFVRIVNLIPDPCRIDPAILTFSLKGGRGGAIAWGLGWALRGPSSSWGSKEKALSECGFEFSDLKDVCALLAHTVSVTVVSLAVDEFGLFSLSLSMQLISVSALLDTISCSSPIVCCCSHGVGTVVC